MAALTSGSLSSSDAVTFARFSLKPARMTACLAFPFGSARYSATNSLFRLVRAMTGRGLELVALHIKCGRDWPRWRIQQPSFLCQPFLIFLILGVPCAIAARPVFLRFL